MKLFERICRAHGVRDELESSRERLYRIAFSWCHDADLADDLVQETMAKALGRSSQLRDQQAIGGWLYRILANEFNDQLRRRRPNVDIDTVALEAGDGVEAIHYQGEVATAVRAAVGRLPVAQRQVLTLVDLEELSYQEVAEVLDIPIGTVMSRLHRARNTLKERLQGWRGGDAQAHPNVRRVK